MKTLASDPLDAAAVLAAVARPGHGGTALFAGTTRDEPELREVVAIEYEAHAEMAEAEIAHILTEARERFGAEVAAVHRVGRVGVGEPSVVVAASAPHRPEAFAACRYLIDELKRRVPIWKRIHHADGTTRWLDGTGADAEGAAPSRG